MYVYISPVEGAVRQAAPGVLLSPWTAWPVATAVGEPGSPNP